MIRAQTKLGKPLLDISRFKEAIKALELEAKKVEFYVDYTSKGETASVLSKHLSHQSKSHGIC